MNAPVLPPANSWQPAEPCSTNGADGSPSIIYGITITGVPSVVGALNAGGQYVWTITLNDGNSPANFSVDRWDGSGNLIDHPIEISGTNGSTQFNDPVFLSEDPQQPMEAATKQYVDANSLLSNDVQPNSGIWGRENTGASGSWVNLAPPTLPYVPMTGASTAAPMTGGIAISAPGGSRYVAGMNGAPGFGVRWAMYYGDATTETGGNAGSNFVLQGFTDGGASNTQLTITRNGVWTIPGQVGITGQLQLGSPSNLQIGGGNSGDTLITDGFGNIIWGAGGAGGIPDAPLTGGPYGRQAATWVAIPPAMADAPAINQMYGRYNNGWVQVAAQFVQLGSAANPVSNQTIYGPLTLSGTAAILTAPAPIYLTGAPANRAIAGMTGGNSPRWAEFLGDNTAESGGNAGSNYTIQRYSDSGALIDVPFSISRANGLVSMPDGATTLAPAPGDNSSLVPTTSWVNTAISATSTPSNTPPLMDGVAAPGTSGAWSRGDHVHPSDTSRVMKSGDTMTGNLAAPSLSGPSVGTAPVASASPLAQDNSLNLATTAWVSQWVNTNARHGENRIINGDMRIDQRNGGASGTATGYTIDRWYYSGSQASKGTWIRAAAGSPLISLGYGYSLNFTSSSAYTPIATDGFSFYQVIEADMVSDFAWGTANAQSVTLSFWVNSSLTGTFGGSIVNYPTPPTRSYPFTFNIPAANTWTKIVVTIPGDTGGTWGMNGNAAALRVMFDLGSGANLRASAGAWTTGNYWSATGAQNIVAVNGASFSITGVKLEIGSVATPFDRNTLAKSRADCERYYLTGAAQLNLWTGATGGGGGASIMFPFPTTMRATPTMTTNFTTQSNATGAVSALSAITYQVQATNPPAIGMMNVYGTFTASAEL